MNADILIEKYDEVHVKISSDDSGLLRDIMEFYTFEVPGAKWHPMVRNGVWDGRIRLFNSKKRTIYAGLKRSVIEWATNNEYDVEDLTSFAGIGCELDLESYETKNGYKLRPYQAEAVRVCLESGRSLILSPTGSGKSLILYALTQAHLAKGHEILIVVPTINLVNQLDSDFVEYNDGQPAFETHKISGGKDKTIEKEVTISTWQSISKMDSSWFSRFDVVMVDECHLAKAKEITTILEKCVHTKYRYGFTGTLDGTATNEMVLVGLFGPVTRVAKTAELMEQGYLAPVKIKALALKYPKEECKKVGKMDYPAEVNYINEHDRRLKFISKMVRSLKGNVIVLFERVEKFGKPLFEDIKSKHENSYLVYGGVDGDERELIRKVVNESNSAIVVASMGTFSTGVNIPNIDNVVLVSAGKAQIRLLQSIGRGVRHSENSDHCLVIDIADDFRYGRKVNFSMKHLKSRIEIYSKEEFEYEFISYTI